MKSIILNSKSKFPCLKQFKFNEEDNSSFIVLFTDNRIGTVVYIESNCNWKLGEYSEEWSMDCFEDFNGEIKLSN